MDRWTTIVLGLPPVRDEQGRLIFAGDPPVDSAEVPVQVVTTQDMYASGRTAISLWCQFNCDHCTQVVYFPAGWVTPPCPFCDLPTPTGKCTQSLVRWPPWVSYMAAYCLPPGTPLTRSPEWVAAHTSPGLARSRQWQASAYMVPASFVPDATRPPLDIRDAFHRLPPSARPHLPGGPHRVDVDRVLVQPGLGVGSLPTPVAGSSADARLGPPPATPAHIVPPLRAIDEAHLVEAGAPAWGGRGAEQAPVDPPVADASPMDEAEAPVVPAPDIDPDLAYWRDPSDGTWYCKPKSGGPWKPWAEHLAPHPKRRRGGDMDLG